MPLLGKTIKATNQAVIKVTSLGSSNIIQVGGSEQLFGKTFHENILASGSMQIRGSLFDANGSSGSAGQVPISQGASDDTVTPGWIWGTGGTGTGAVTSIANNTNNNILTAGGGTILNGESNLTFDGTDLTLGSGDLYGKSVNADQSKLYKFGGLYFTWDSDNYGTSLNHSITSTDNTSFSDSITLNSFDKVRINIDSNDNNDPGNESTFSIGHHTTGTANTLLNLTEAGNFSVEGYVEHSRLGSFGQYSSTQVQGIWSIGTAYAIDTGSDDFGNLYGMGYAYNQNGGSPFASEHQIVFTHSGTIHAAIGLRGDAYYNGDVGIGTTTPTEKLELGSGNIKLANGGIFVEYSNASLGGACVFPGGGMYRSNTNSHTGAIKIQMPTGTGTIADMLSFWVDVYDYTTNESFSAFIAGYAYQTVGQNEWNNISAQVITSNHNKNYTIRFGHDNSHHCVLIGETTSTWSYPQVTIRNMQVGYNADIDDYNEGFVISFVTSLPTIDETVSNNFPFAKGLASSDNIPVYIGTSEEFRFSTNGTFHADGDVIGFSSTISSDKRLKENIVDTKYGLNDVLKLRGVDFNWKEKLNKRQEVGLIAQEVQEVVPELVKEVDELNGEEKFLAVDYAKLVPVLVEAIKDQQEQINQLKKQIESK